MRAKLAAVVFTYNRRDIVETTLRSARFAERLVVIDKGSTDGTAEIGRRYADEFHAARWTPTVEATKAEYIPKIDAEWLLVLDDDECLSLEAIAYIQVAVRKDDFDVHYLPLRHHILGRHDERAYYWPEHHPVLFRQGALSFGEQVHGGKNRISDRYKYVPPESGVSILHLSHPDVRTWIEKTNRYTEERNRSSSASLADVTPEGVGRLMQNWLSKVEDKSDPYLTAVAALRGIYDIVDVVKLWEQHHGKVGEPGFESICNELNTEYDALGIERRPAGGSSGRRVEP